MIIQRRGSCVEFFHFPDKLFDLVLSESRTHHATESLDTCNAVIGNWDRHSGLVRLRD